ncbi:uncharacterized protein TNCV_897381 [Trichonephila clavipes]|nr:uncharacterized protein TNCV_897381 [Trichonephila clavipes]
MSLRIEDLTVLNVLIWKAFVQMRHFSHSHALNLHLGPKSGNNLFTVSPIRYSVLQSLIDVPLGLSLNPGEDMDVCKCIVPSRHGSTLNSRRAANPLVRLVEGEERWEAPDHPQGVLTQKWGETKLNRSITCMVIKATLTTGVT